MINYFSSHVVTGDNNKSNDWNKKQFHVKTAKKDVSKAALLGGAPGYPNELFTNSEIGAWYDPSFLPSMSQTPDGPSGNVQVDDNVGRLEDLSGNGHHLYANGSNRPFLKQLGSRYFLAVHPGDEMTSDPFSDDVFDGVMCVGTQVTGTAQAQMYVSWGSPSGTRLMLRVNQPIDLRIVETQYTTFQTAQVLDTAVLTVLMQGTNSLTELQENGSTIASDPTGPATPQTFTQIKLAEIREISRFFGAVFRSGILTSEELTSLQQFMNEKTLT